MAGKRNLFPESMGECSRCSKNGDLYIGKDTGNLVCRKCYDVERKTKSHRIWRDKNRDRVNECAAKSREKNKEKIKKRTKERYWKDPDKHRLARKNYADANKEKIREKRIQYRKDNIELARQKGRESYSRHRDKILARSRERNKDPKVKKRRSEYNKKYRKLNQHKLKQYYEDHKEDILKATRIRNRKKSQQKKISDLSKIALSMIVDGTITPDQLQGGKTMDVEFEGYILHLSLEEDGELCITVEIAPEDDDNDVVDIYVDKKLEVFLLEDEEDENEE